MRQDDMPNESRDVVVTVGNVRFTPTMKDGFDDYRRDHFSSIPQAICALIYLALSVLGYVPQSKRANVGIRRFDPETERRLSEAENRGVARAEALAVILRIGGKHYEAMGYIDPLAEVEERQKAG